MAGLRTKVEIFTDGACSGNPGPGGWGAILRWGSEERELYGGEPETTNNRMEMTAAIAALEALKRPVIAVMTRSEEHTSELQSLMRISYAVFCLKKKNKTNSNMKI